MAIGAHATGLSAEDARPATGAPSGSGHIKADDLDLRPVLHRLEERVGAHGRPPLPQLPRPPGPPDPQPGPPRRHQRHRTNADAATSTQRQAFDLISVPIPLILK
jgi:hypothetical protein